MSAGRVICLAIWANSGPLCSLFPLSFQVFHSPIDGGDEFIVSLAFGPSLFRSQHIGELGQHVAFFLHYFLSVSLTTRTGFLPPSPPAEKATTGQVATIRCMPRCDGL